MVEVLESIECLPRVACIVLADMSISNSLCNVIAEIKNKYNIRIISLNVSDCLSNHVDLVVTDAVQAGVMAVMAIAETSNLDIDRIKEVL